VRILVTGMSGTGKSSALGELRRLGFETVETDRDGWSVWSGSAGGWIWVEERMAALLAGERETPLFVSGCVSNQGWFYPRFDAVVLLSAPAEVLLRRLETRTTNDYGKAPAERELVREQLAEIEPLLRATCTHEIDATLPLAEVVAWLAAIARGTDPAA
jgi:dephospho-CoA kinase